MRRREYVADLRINGRPIKKVIIDPHYEAKHSASITDELIVSLVETLDGEIIEPDQETPPYSYFATDRIELNGRFYKLIWLLEAEQIYVGVVNAYRR